MRVGVFVCECGGNISSAVNVDALCSEARLMPDVIYAEHIPFLCSKPGLEAIKAAVKSHLLERVVVASCSPHYHETVFRETIGEAGVNQYLLESVNIREQCSWVHSDKEEATRKATDLIRGAVYKARLLEPLDLKPMKLNQDVLVIGGGVAGITCALQLAEAGYKVTLVERSPSIGGHMAQLSKTFPTLDCAPCILGPKMAEVAKHRNITLFTNAVVEHVSGQVGSFRVRVRHNPRGVDLNKCVGCGLCAEKCPVNVPSEFDLGLYPRKAVYKPFPEAVPIAYTIDSSSCKHCGLCARACPTGAINLKEEVRVSEHTFGAIIIATGYDLIDVGAWKNFQQNDNVLTALQMERLAIRELAAGKILKRSDGKRVRRIAYVLCFGSRDSHKGVSYCSNICCAYSVKQAVLLKKTLPYLQIWLYYNDMRMGGRGLEELYSEARRLGIYFIHGKPNGIAVTAEGELEIVAEDKDSGQLFENHVDFVVLATAMVPSIGTAELAKVIGVSLGEDGFVAEKHPKMAPVATQRPGIFAAGTILGPKDVKGSVADGMAAAGEAARLLRQDHIFLDPVKPIVAMERCTGCGHCVSPCPYGAIDVSSGKAVVDKAACQGCGICVSICPVDALELELYRRKQLEAQVEGLLKGRGGGTKILGFVGEGVAYSALDAVGTSRLNYSSAMFAVRVPSTATVDLRLILHAFMLGADGIILFEEDGSKQAKATEERLKEIRDFLKSRGVEEERVILQPTLLPLFRVLGEQIDAYVKKVEKLDRLEAKPFFGKTTKEAG